MKPNSSLRVLLVEDSDSDARLLQENIRLSGVDVFHVSIVPSLHQAIHHLQGNPVDVTLLDLSLPDSSGLETVQELRRVRPGMPIVVLTGVDDEKTGIEAVRMGVQDYLVKGQVDGRLIARAIRYAIERNLAEEELRQTRDYLENLLNHANAPIIVWDPEFRITRFNQAFESLTGRDTSDVLGRPLDLLFPPDRREEAMSHIRRAAAGERWEVVDIPIVHVDGTVRTVLWNSATLYAPDGKTVAATIAQGQDITDRKQAEEALRQARDGLELRVKERTTELAQMVEMLRDEVARRALAEHALRERSRLLEAFFRHAVTPLVFLDPEFNFVRVNEAYAKACQKDVSDFPGHNHFEFYPNEENQAIFENVVRTKTPYQAIAKPFTFPDHPEWGVTYWNWALTPLLDEAGDVEFLVFALEDVSERTKAQQELIALNETLTLRTQQLRALTSELTVAEQRERQRLALVLHDHLQQFLVAAKLHVTPLQRSEDRAARQAAFEVSELIRQSIDASRSLAVELSPPVLHQGGLIEALRWLARWMHEKHQLEIEMTLDEQAVPKEEDVAILLFQAVRELLFNVAKHAGVKTARVEVCRVDGQIQITIMDEGAGFDPSKVRPGGGLTGGLGLVSVRERLDFLGGRMEIDSAPGRGSLFRLVVPIEEAAAPKPAPSEQAGIPSKGRHPGAVSLSAAPHQRGRKIRVVLADDHAVTRQGLARLLREEPDIEIIGEAGDGEAAVSLIRQLLPDVAILDINMPGMTGLEATRLIHAELPDVKIIGLSMFEELERAPAMREAGAVGYLTKSGPPEAVITAVRAHARRPAGRIPTADVRSRRRRGTTPKSGKTKAKEPDGTRKPGD